MDITTPIRYLRSSEFIYYHYQYQSNTTIVTLTLIDIIIIIIIDVTVIVIDVVIIIIINFTVSVFAKNGLAFRRRCGCSEKVYTLDSISGNSPVIIN